MTTLSPLAAAELILASRGRFFTAVFTKKDGTTRRMTARTGVRKHVTGAGLKFDPAERGLLVVFDVNAPSRRPRSILRRHHRGDYRMIMIATLRELRIDGVTYTVDRTLSLWDYLGKEAA